MAKKVKIKLKLKNGGMILTRPRSRTQPEEYVAVFRERSDGDWDFVMMCTFGEGTFPQMSQAEDDDGTALINKVAEAINDEHDRALILYFGDPDCPSIYEMQVDEAGNATVEVSDN